MMNERINDFCAEAKLMAEQHGFHEGWTKSRNMAEVSGGEFGVEKEEIDHAYFAKSIALIQSELSEALEADRHGNHASLPKFFKAKNKDGQPFEEAFKANVKDTVEDELADAMIRIFDLCGFLNIDLQQHITLKMMYNSARPRLHGKKY